MSKVQFVGLDVHAETIAVAVAETGGEVRSLGVIPKSISQAGRRGFASRLPLHKINNLLRFRECQPGETQCKSRLDVISVLST